MQNQKSWETYRQEFVEEAQKKGLPARKIALLADYAQQLFDKQLPIIFNIEHLSRLVGYTEDYLNRVVNNTKNFYRHYSIPKKNGKRRDIREPLPSLKEIQQWILHNILYKIPCSPYSKAYRNGLSVKDNARFHKNQPVVLSMDLEDYFPSLKIERVMEFFRNLGYTSKVTDMLAMLCCLENCLPQGSPTSPYLSNLLTVDLDTDLGNLAKTYNIRYTRYADDITFSGELTPGVIINKCKRIIEAHELQLNFEKIRAQEKHEQQLVTGIIVNNRKLTVPKEKRRELRQHIYYIRKFGVEKHMINRNIHKKNFLKHLLGIANHILHINPHDEEIKNYKAFLLGIAEHYED